MSERQIRELEAAMEEANKAKALNAALERLMGNRDFQAVVLVGFLQQEAVRLVQAKAAPDNQSPEKQSAILRGLDAVGHFHQFLLNVSLQAEVAEKTLEDSESERDLLLARG